MLYIQDPTFEDSKLLLDAILECCQEATLGGGAYAYVTADGATLLIGNPIFESFLSTGEFELIIGIDDITNTRTLVTLRNYCEKHDNLRVNVFLPDTTSSRFHPKFCWFDCGDYGFTITGSGNLTKNGITRNWEAYEHARLTGEAFDEMKSRWAAWRVNSEPNLKSLDDEDVIAKAEENKNKKSAKQRRYKKRRREERSDPDSAHPVSEVVENEDEIDIVDDEIETWEFDSTSDVLIAEVTKGGGRWSQVGFNLPTWQKYFKVDPRVVNPPDFTLRDVKQNGLLGNIIKRPPRKKGSQNYYFQLEVGTGTLYPDNGCPIVVFIEIFSKMFLYMLVLPDYAVYNILKQLLNTHRAKENEYVRYTTTVDELQKQCPNIPLLDYLSQTER